MEGTARGFAHAVDFAATLLPVAEHAIRWYETSWSDRVSALKVSSAPLPPVASLILRSRPR